MSFNLSETDSSELSSVAKFGDHALVYVSKADVESLLSGEIVTMDLESHPMFKKLSLKTNDKFQKRSTVGEISIYRGSNDFYDQTIHIEFPREALTSGPESKMEPGGSRDYIFRFPGWRHPEFGATWEESVESIRKQISAIVK